MAKNPDVIIRNHGSVVQFDLLTQEVMVWVRDNLETEGWQWMGRALCVDHRFAEPVAAMMEDAGFIVR